MARAKVEQVQCDRCKRMELLPLRDVPVNPDAAFTASLQTVDEKGQPTTLALHFQDICPRCRKTLQNYWQSFAEWERDGKALVGLEDDKAPPLQPAPSVTPPRPHSPGAIKK